MARTTIAGEILGPEASIRSDVRRQVLSGLWSALAAPVARAMAAHAERRRTDHAIAQLRSLSDHMLKDIGVQRHDIERVVRYGRDATELRK